MLMNASTMNQMQKATRAASRRKTSNRSINYLIIKSIINQKNNAYSAKQISQPIITSIDVQNLIVKQFFQELQAMDIGLRFPIPLQNYNEILLKLVSISKKMQNFAVFCEKDGKPCHFPKVRSTQFELVTTCYRLTLKLVSISQPSRAEILTI